jgi:hypothetical protein
MFYFTEITTRPPVVPVVLQGQLELPIKFVLPNAFTFLQLDKIRS